MREVTAERMRRAGAQMPTHFFEHDDTDAARRFVDLLQPAAEAQPDHAAALEPAGAELLDAAGDRTVAVANGPAGSLAEIEGEDHRWRRFAAGEHLDRHRRRSACIRLSSFVKVIVAMEASIGLSW